ncbi:unnamed protein product [Jaminaea pallidilutea]
MDQVQGRLASLRIGDAQAKVNAVILRYLREHMPNSRSLEAFSREAVLGVQDDASTPDLFALLSVYEGQQRLINPSASVQKPSTEDSVWPRLAGPSRLQYSLDITHSLLHASNVLVLRPVLLPRRRFNTAPSDGSDPRFETTFAPCLLSAGADKRVLIFDPDDGEVAQSLEPVARSMDQGHTAAVLDVTQHPHEPRELVTAGMDGKVIVWDLLTGKPHVAFKDHQRFVVRCTWSADGRYLATAGYDKVINIYRRRASVVTNGAGEDRMEEDGPSDIDDDIEARPLDSKLELVYTLSTRGNPEAIAFVAAEDKTQWLVWSMRDDCFLHYLQMQDKEGTSPAPEGSSWLESKYNTNEVAMDTHISYSILSITPHPTLPLLSLVTGSHASQSASSLVLLMPLFSDQRQVTIHTTVPAGTSYTPRQAWLPSGEGVWISSEEGLLKLYDLQGQERCEAGVHGAASERELTGMSAEEKAKRWRMGTMNGVIKDVVVLDDGRVASCGFDRTVRVLSPVTT